MLCSPHVPYAHLGSKLGAQSCRTDQYRWFRLVGEPRLFAQSSRDRNTWAYLFTPSPVIHTTLGGSDLCAGIFVEMWIWAIQVTLGDSGWHIICIDLYHMAYIFYCWDIRHGIFVNFVILSMSVVYICILFSGKLYRFYGEGLLRFKDKVVFKNFVFAHSHFLLRVPPGSR